MDPKECLAIVDGETTVEGLKQPVKIIRDRWGIPHIKAQTMEDAFFGQGFCMAQDRAWQIEMIRQMAHGRAAALINRGLLPLDIQNRRLGFGRLAAAEWEEQTPQARAVLLAYAAGINAAIATQPVPFEFQSIGHKMLPWTPVDSLTIVKMINTGTQMAGKLKFGQVAAQLGAEAVDALIAEVPQGSAVIVPSGAKWTGEEHPFADDIARTIGQPAGLVTAGGGSNCWVVDGERSASGAPMVVGDPHLGMALPGQWYVMHMECPEFTAAGPCNPGYPGPIYYGHNGKVAWTMTNAQGDRWDLYREKMSLGTSGPKSLYRGQWEPIELREERFEVRGGDTVTERFWRTRHGPVIAGSPELDDEVVAARWGLAAPAHDMDGLLSVLRASSAEEARAGFRTYDSVSGNFCFADAGGNLGYQYSGRIPRRPGWLVPVPGWTGEFEWEGDVPKGELPNESNPGVGYLLSANNRTTTPEYTQYLTYVATSFRSDRLRELIEATDRFDADDMRRIQADQTSVVARALSARFARTSPAGAGARQLRDLFADWGGELAADSPAALAYDAVCTVLSNATVAAYLKRAAKPPSITALEERRLLFQQVQADSPLMLAAGATWDVAIEQAMDGAFAALSEQFGGDISAWRWDAVHRLQWRHNLGRDGELAELLNMPVVPVGGDGTTLFCTTAERNGMISAGVSFRQILDLADLNGAQVCIPPGNSGQPGSPHYDDNLDRWLNVEYHPLYINWDDIAANAEATLDLKP